MKHIQSIVGVFLSMALVAPVPHALAEDVTKPQSPLTSEEWRLYQELSQRIKDHYVEPVDEQRLLKGCLSGMARELDAHSAYLPPVPLKNLSSDAENPAGIGLTLGIRNNRPQVIATLEDAPAAHVDIRRGDVLARIDGELVLDRALDDVVARLRGKAGTSVRIGLLRSGSPDIIEHSLKRVIIAPKGVKSRQLEPGYGYIHINAIHQDTPKALIKAVQTLYPAGQAKARGLVLDLRDNYGGLLDRSLALAATFLPEDALLLSTKGQAENSTTTWRATKDALGGLLRSQSRDAPAVMKDLPLVVLVNGGTAAGAEIVAGALQDHQRAVLIGTPTFGKDSLQQILPLRNDGAVKLTVERWRTPKGRSVSPGGLAPDIVIGTDVGAGAVADPVLDKALAVLKEKSAGLNQADAGQPAWSR